MNVDTYTQPDIDPAEIERMHVAELLDRLGIETVDELFTRLDLNGGLAVKPLTLQVLVKALLALDCNSEDEKWTRVCDLAFDDDLFQECLRADLLPLAKGVLG